MFETLRSIVVLTALTMLLGQARGYCPVPDGDPPVHLEIAEATQNALMLQGDHGPVAFRNLYVRPLRPIVVR